MNTQEALNVLINAVTVGTRRGAFELSETESILNAVKVFTAQSTKSEDKNSPETAQSELPLSETKDEDK